MNWESRSEGRKDLKKGEGWRAAAAAAAGRQELLSLMHASA
jgi:hypothetical protein